MIVRSLVPTLVSLVVVWGSSSVAVAQPQEAESTPPSTPSAPPPLPQSGQQRMPVLLQGAVSGIFRSDGEIDSGGEVSLFQLKTALSSRITLAEDLQLTISGSYQQDRYDFDDASAFGLGVAEAWQDVHTYGMTAMLMHTPDTQWRVFGGALVRDSREEGSDMWDGLTAGGMFGVSHTLSETLRIGGGFGLTSEIKDDVNWFPILDVEWKINERLRLTSNSGVDAFSRARIELEWQYDDEWTIAGGIGFERRRFRLADDNPAAPDGFGEDRSFPLFVRLTYKPDPTYDISLLAGTVSGRLRLGVSDGGDIVSEQDYDSQIGLGVAFRLRF